MRTRQILPKVKQRRVSKYQHLLGKVLGSRKVLQSLPRSLFEVQCIECNHLSVQRGIDLEKLKDTECQNCKIQRRNPNLNNAYLRTKNNAKSRGLDFLISKEYFGFISEKNCYYCGSKPMQDSKDFVERCPAYNGLDRLNPKVGYVEGNVVSCCKYCNYAKHDMSVEDFIFWIKRCHGHISDNF